MSRLPHEPIARLLRMRATATPEHVLAVDDAGQSVTCRQMADRVATMVRWLGREGVAPGERVVSAIGNGLDHVTLFFACCMAGIVWVPVNPESRGPVLAHMLARTRPRLVVHEDGARARLLKALNDTTTPCVNRDSENWRNAATDASQAGELPALPAADDLDGVRCVIFTSGTTGPPKGVMVTERMLLAAATATRMASRCEAGDGFLMWEPLHHIGGSQLCVLALLESIHLRVIPRFSAGRFWNQVRAWNITRLHYLGGILDILLSAPATARDREHPARLAFGAGARPEVWCAFRARFGMPVHEVYGMTEASSFTTLNDEGVVGSVGRALPWFELELVDADGRCAGDGPGELTVRGREPGLLTPGYLGDPEATRRLLRDGRLFTGDLMRRDAAGHYWFAGRRGDAIRRRGENLSAWEVEQALLLHPGVAETAVIGVDARIGEQDVHAYVRRRDPALTYPDLLAWCREHLGAHQVPRYFSFLEAFPRTPSQRVDKATLRGAGGERWDSENAEG